MSNSFSAHNPEYASAAVIVAQAMRAMLAAPPVNVADFAAANRWLVNEGGGYVGRWNHAEAPYLIGPMDALTDDSKLTVVVVGPGQSGKSEIGRNWLFTTACEDPANMLWYSSSEPLVTSEVKTRIMPMENDHQAMRSRLARPASLSSRRYGSCVVEFLPGILSNFTSKSAPRIVADEFDAICKYIPSAKELLDVRRQTFGQRSKLLLLCHPDLARSTDEKTWNAGIMEQYRASDQAIWYWECPECRCWSSPNPTAARVMTLHYDIGESDDEIRQNARLLCPVNGCLVEDGQRKTMNLTGKWVRRGQVIDQDGTVSGEAVERDSAGFWITGVMSPFMIGGIGGLAVSLANAERRYQRDNDRQAMSEVFSKRAGVPLPPERKVGEIDAAAVAERCEAGLVMGIVPNGVRFITAFADVQSNRFEVLVRGWGVNGESWVIDYLKIPADTAVSPDDWDALIRLMSDTAWPLADGSGRGMKARLVGFDSGGEAGVTLLAYDTWRRARAARQARPLGKIDGRDCWSVIPTKGASGVRAPRLQVVFPDSQGKSRFSGSRGDIPLALFNPNDFKDDLMNQVNRAEPGRWAVHFPAALKISRDARNVRFDQAFGETAAAVGMPAPPKTETMEFFDGMINAERRQPNKTWTRVVPKIPNEPMDLMVGTHVLAHLTGLTRLNWVSPPAWCREWHENSNVVTLAAGAPPGSPLQAARDGAPGLVNPAPAVTARAVLPQTARAVPSVAVITSVPVRR